MFATFANAQISRHGQIGSNFQGTFESYNKFGLPSLIIPVPCQANKLQEQVNYICAHGNIWCLPGWKVSIDKIRIEVLGVFYTSQIKSNPIKICYFELQNERNYCRDPDCPEGCPINRGVCHQPNVCTCKVGYFGHTCANCVTLPGCMHGSCNESFECNCFPGWQGIYCDIRKFYK